jgi:DNA damage-binding protein 1
MVASRVTDLKTHYMGETSIASTISYLDSGLVYIGSRFGDSQVGDINLNCSYHLLFLVYYSYTPSVSKYKMF